MVAKWWSAIRRLATTATPPALELTGGAQLVGQDEIKGNGGWHIDITGGGGASQLVITNTNC